LQAFPLFAVISAKAEIHNRVQKTDNNAASAETHGLPPARSDRVQVKACQHLKRLPMEPF
ncbi:hypothetical protein, partial [Oceanimonas baumannii]|uniref:hypothetical protein n=1 Tax=Oceanimonas baumannii TaxID=129578 RepID=UPI001AB02715